MAEWTDKSNHLRREVTSWIVLAVLTIVLLLSIPWAVKKFLTLTLSRPFAAQREAISKSNKTSDTASGVVGTFVNNIPYSDFERLINLNSRSFKKVDIQIPKIYIASPIFNTSEYGDELQDIWLSSLNNTVIKEEFGSYSVYYDGNLIIEDDKVYSSKDATKTQIDSMKKALVTELATNKKWKKIQFQKWYIPKEGSDPTITKIIKNGFSIESTFEVKDFKPNWLFPPTLHQVKAEFILKNNKLVLKKQTLEVD